MVTFARKATSTRAGSDQRSAIVVEGEDLIAARFTKDAVTIGPKSGAVAVTFAGQAAEKMRSRVRIDEGDLLDSITADTKPTTSAAGVYADAGPSPSANDAGAFKGPFFEHGTVKMPPDPFVGPAGDEVFDPFVRAIKGLV